MCEKAKIPSTLERGILNIQSKIQNHHLSYQKKIISRINVKKCKKN